MAARVKRRTSRRLSMASHIKGAVGGFAVGWLALGRVAAELGWYRVVAAFMPGVAAAQAAQGHPGSGHGTMYLNTFHGIMGTTGMKAAVIP